MILNVLKSVQKNTHHLLSMGDPSRGFTPARPGRILEAPFALYSWDKIQTEWWYYTGHLTSENNQRFGFEFVIFKRLTDADHVGVFPLRWINKTMFASHMALSDIDCQKFQYAERGGLFNLLQNGVASQDHFYVRCDDWFMTEINGNHHLLAESPNKEGSFGLNLSLKPMKPLITNGLHGYSRKGDNPEHASYYVSYPRMDASGIILHNGKTHRVSGTAWMDHEKMSTPGDTDQVGWDWFALQFNNGSELMVYDLRKKDGTTDRWSSGSYISLSGEKQHLSRRDYKIEVLDYWISRKTGIRWPSRWKITLPAQKLSLIVTPLIPHQELDTLKSTTLAYWEGAVSVDGFLETTPISGQGYTELVGYDHRIQHKVFDFLLRN